MLLSKETTLNQSTIYIRVTYMHISSFDLGCADEFSKSKTAAVHRLIVYYTS